MILAGIAVTVLYGAASMGVGWLLGVLVGGPTPIAEALNGGQAASVVALVFGLAATLVTSFVLRVLGRDG